MAYQVFSSKAVKFGTPQLTIRSGRIAFNADAGDILAEIGMRNAHVLWDAKEHRLAIRPIEKPGDNTFKISLLKGKRGCAITASSFLKYIGWDADEPVSVDALWNEATGLFEAVLPSEYLVGEARAKGRTGRRRGTIG
jgi:hypothetical protein